MTKPSTPTIPPTQEEKLAALLNDQKLRKANRRDDTFQSRAVADFDIPLGRFTERERATVVGSEGAPNYPSASPPLQNDPVPDEPALGFSVDQQQPCGEAFEVEKSLASASLPHSPDADAEKGDAVVVREIASPKNLAELGDDPAQGTIPSLPDTRSSRDVGSSSSPIGRGIADANAPPSIGGAEGRRWTLAQVDCRWTLVDPINNQPSEMSGPPPHPCESGPHYATTNNVLAIAPTSTAALAKGVLLGQSLSPRANTLGTFSALCTSP